MISEPDVDEQEIGWATLIEACRHAPLQPVIPRWKFSPLIVNITPRLKFPVRACRDWLHADATKMAYRLTGLFEIDRLVTARFAFEFVDERMLFCLRWL